MPPSIPQAQNKHRKAASLCFKKRKTDTDGIELTCAGSCIKLVCGCWNISDKKQSSGTMNI